MEPPEGSFHAHDNWYFKRLEDGVVRVTHLNVDHDPLIVDFDPESWASIVSSVTESGETSMTFSQVFALHMR